MSCKPIEKTDMLANKFTFATNEECTSQPRHEVTAHELPCQGSRGDADGITGPLKLLMILS